MRNYVFWLLGLLCGLPLLCGGLLIGVANTQTGRDFLVESAASLTDKRLILTGLAGHFPERVDIGRVLWQDDKGVLTIDNAQLLWNPWQLLKGVVDIQLLQAAHLSFAATGAATGQPPDFSSLSSPLRIKLDKLHLEQFEMAMAGGQTVSVMLDGQAQFKSLKQGELQVSVKDRQHNGDYSLVSHVDADGVHAQVSVQEPAQGLLAMLAGWQDSKPLTLTGSVDGPMEHLTTQVELNWELLKATVQGAFNAQNQQADWQITANAPAMQAYTGLAWQQLAINGRLQGALTKPSIDGHIDIQDLHFATTKIGQLQMVAQGNGGQLHLTGTLATLMLADGRQDVLQARPVSLQADVRLDQAQRPLTLSLQHPLFSVTGQADTALQPNATLEISLPNLQPLTKLAGLDMSGQSTLVVKARQQGDKLEIALDGGLAMTGGQAVLAKLLGKQADFGMTVSLAGVGGVDKVLSRCQLHGKAITVQANGSLKDQLAQLNWQLGISDVGAIVATANGKLDAQGQINGLLTDFSTVADVSGEVGTATLPRKPITAKLKVEHLPSQANGELTGNMLVAGAPFELAMAVKPQPNQTLQLNVNRADWKSVHSQGLFTVAMAAAKPWPIGNLTIGIKRLEDLRTLLKQPLAGALTATLKTALPNSAYLTVDARDTQLPGNTTLAHAKLALTARDALDTPRLNGQLEMEGLGMGAVTGSGHLDFNGTFVQLAVQVSGHADGVAGAHVDVNSKGVYSVNAQELELTGLDALWQKQQLRLLAPVSISLGNALGLKHLQMALGEARLQADGQFSPVLDIKAQLQQVNLEAFKELLPNLPAAGKVSATVNLQGTPERPRGTLTINADNLRIVNKNGKALPPAQLNATVSLDGNLAAVQAKFKATDNANLTLTGTAPLNATGLLDLHGKGLLELKLFDALLAANGRRVRGQVAIDVAVMGTLGQPQLTGTATLTKVELRDYAIGANITAINGVIRAKDQQLLLERLQGQAGEGTIVVKGSIDMFKAGFPVNLQVTAKNAKPLASDRLAVDLNADLTLRGLATEHLLLLGAIKINRADIRIPEHLPANLAVLKLKTPGKAEPPAPVDSNIALNLVISAVDEVFVRGRGVDAELDGTVQVHGTTSKPEAEGGFKLRRGQYTLGGKALNFSQGRVSFDNGRLTDPSLNFIVTNSKNSITTTLTIGGTANKPKITLSSVPELPPDELLARLLFGQSANSLSLLEMLQIGSAVAALSGATSGMGDPLDSVRQTLGLDRLTVGGQNTSLEAGRYVVPGVYLGTRQGLAGTPQATIQIDLTKHIKLEAAVGATTSTSSSANPNSLGVVYEFDY